MPITNSLKTHSLAILDWGCQIPGRLSTWMQKPGYCAKLQKVASDCFASLRTRFSKEEPTYTDIGSDDWDKGFEKWEKSRNVAKTTNRFTQIWDEKKGSISRIFTSFFKKEPSVPVFGPLLYSDQDTESND